MTVQNMTPMTPEQYAEHWEKESAGVESQGLYKRLSDITPQGNVLEVGSGTGLSTRHLATSRKVFCIDNNKSLVNKARATLKDKLGSGVSVIHADLFKLSPQNINLINDFSPQGIVCWLMGTDPKTVDKHSDTSQPLVQRPKLYRENVEDQLLTKKVCTETVEWIHLANRGFFSAGTLEAEVIQDTKDRYNTYVFSPKGFEVVNVGILKWALDDSEFPYVNTSHPDYNPTIPIPCIISILAKRLSLSI